MHEGRSGSTQRWDLTGQLLQAAGDGEKTRVRKLLAAGADGPAALLLAVQGQNNEAVKQLTRGMQKAAMTASDEAGITLLHQAAALGYAIELLLDAGAAVSAEDVQGRTPLHHAATHGQAKAIAALLAAGASSSAADDMEFTPLHHAACFGRQAAAETLLEAGASVAAADGGGMTPLHYAAICRHQAAVQTLLAAGASLAAVDAEGFTPLHMAAWFGSPATVKVLLAAGASVAAVDNKGMTPLHCALCFHPLKKQKPRSETATEDTQQMPEKCQKVVRRLLRAGADAGAADAAGATPLLLAAGQGSTSIVEQLLSSKPLQACHIAAARKAAHKAGHAATAATLAAALVAARRAEAAVQVQHSSSSDGTQTPPPQQQQQLMQRMPQKQQQKQHQQQHHKQQQQQQGKDTGEHAPGSHSCAAPLKSKVKAEGVARGVSSQQAATAALLGPLATRLQQQAQAAGMPPNEQQQEYFMLADQPFDGPELLQLYRKHLAPKPEIRYRVLRNGAVAERETGLLGPSHVERAYPALAPGFKQLVADVENSQQQQQQGNKKRQRSSCEVAIEAAAAAAATEEPSDAARVLLLALRCLLHWEGQLHRQPALPLLLQLLLFGGPAPAVEGVVECIDLAACENDEALNMQLMQQGAELLLVKEVLPKQQQQQQQDGSDSSGETGGGGSSSRGRDSGRASVKQEPAGVNWW